jgi:hypothetical protein
MTKRKPGLVHASYCEVSAAREPRPCRHLWTCARRLSPVPRQPSMLERGKNFREEVLNDTHAPKRDETS